MKNLFKYLFGLMMVVTTLQTNAVPIFIANHSNGTKTSVDIDTNSTGAQAHAAVSAATGIPVDQLKLVSNSKVLPKDDTPIAPFRLAEQGTLHVIRSGSAASGVASAAAVDPRDRRIAELEARILELETLLLADTLL